MRKAILLILCIGLNAFMCMAQTRGAAEGEIYYSTSTYIDDQGQVRTAIFRSTDHGAHLQLQYESTSNPPVGEMAVGRVLGDATPGALYNYGSNELWVSFDYGKNWVFNEEYPDNTYYLSGISKGMIYSTKNIKLNKSNNYGNSFNIITDPLTIPIPEIGFTEGEFFGIDGDACVQFKLVHTFDYANSYTENAIDSAVAFYSISGYWPRLSRGTEHGELYLVSWWADSHFKIFHSIDNGCTWTQQSESDYIDLYFWSVSYTAGRQPGSFYVFRNYLEHMGTYRELFIDYSSDYGQTFTTFHHVLDSAVSVAEPNPEHSVRVYPNPFSSGVTFEHRLSNGEGLLSIRSMTGSTVFTAKLNGAQTPFDLSHLPQGAYIYAITTGGHPVYRGAIVKQ